MIPLPQISNAVPKVHPLDREMLPEDPLEMQAFEVPGDTELMFRIVVEEFARMGWDRAAIVATARDDTVMATTAPPRQRTAGSVHRQPIP